MSNEVLGRNIKLEVFNIELDNLNFALDKVEICKLDGTVLSTYGAVPNGAITPYGVIESKFANP